MKKIIALLLIGVLLCSSIVFADGSTIMIDDKEAAIAEGMGSVKNISDRTFVPVRFMLEYFGYTVVWDEESQLVAGYSDDNSFFALNIGAKTLFHGVENGETKKTEMDVAAFLDETEDRTYVPLRFLAEAFGFLVDYDEATDTVIITSQTEITE